LAFKQQSRGFKGPAALYLLFLVLKDTRTGRPLAYYYYQYAYDGNYQVAERFFFKKHLLKTLFSFVDFLLTKRRFFVKPLS
jgi:hypothetical protein